MPPWLEHFAVAVCAISGVLAAAGRGIDLFGVLVLALVTAVGGGTIAIANEAGTFVIEQGQTAFVANQNRAPVITFEKPLLPPPQAGAVQVAVAEVPSEQRAGSMRPGK